jgi:transposase
VRARRSHTRTGRTDDADGIDDTPAARRHLLDPYPAAATEAWLDGHNRAFVFFGGVPLSILYDNDKCLVSRILPDGTRQRMRY